jgi:hypothetical protein
MKGATFTLAGLIFARTGIAQDFPPGVLLLSRVKTNINDELRLLTTISCLETVQREHQAAKGKMRLLDTIRLEVLTNGDKELFASPGDWKFSENHPMTYAGSGTLGNGLFGPYLNKFWSAVASPASTGRRGSRWASSGELRLPNAAAD